MFSRDLNIKQERIEKQNASSEPNIKSQLISIENDENQENNDDDKIYQKHKNNHQIWN